MVRRVRQVVDFKRVIWEVVEGFDWFRFKKCTLGLVKFAIDIKFAPVAVSQLLVSIVVVQAVGQIGLIVSDVLPVTDPKRPTKITLFIKPIGVAECGVA